MPRSPSSAGQGGAAGARADLEVVSVMPFGADARSQQSRYRATLPVSARDPADDKGQRHGHLLALGSEIENLVPDLRGPDGALSFFRARRIKWWRNARSGDGRGGGPTRNLASSQVACVNFLLPLARRPAALLTLMQRIDPEVIDLISLPDPGGAEPSPVEFEWVGWDAPIEGGRLSRGAMQTSADAVVVGRTAGGLRAFVFEWKYCEEYLRPEDKGEGSSGDTRRRRYTARYAAVDSAFRGDVPLDEYLFEPFYQLLRLRLLADEIRRSGFAPGMPVRDARVVVVCPAANEDYRLAVASTPLARRFPALPTVERIMQATLHDPRDLVIVDSEMLVQALRASPVAPDIGGWLDYHALRYGW